MIHVETRPISPDERTKALAQVELDHRKERGLGAWLNGLGIALLVIVLCGGGSGAMINGAIGLSGQTRSTVFIVCLSLASALAITLLLGGLGVFDRTSVGSLAWHRRKLQDADVRVVRLVPERAWRVSSRRRLREDRETRQMVRDEDAQAVLMKLDDHRFFVCEKSELEDHAKGSFEYPPSWIEVVLVLDPFLIVEMTASKETIEVEGELPRDDVPLGTVESVHRIPDLVKDMESPVWDDQPPS